MLFMEKLHGDFNGDKCKSELFVMTGGYSDFPPKLWVWLKIRGLGDHKYEYMFSINHLIIGVPNFDPYPYDLFLRVLTHPESWSWSGSSEFSSIGRFFLEDATENREGKTRIGTSWNNLTYLT